MTLSNKKCVPCEGGVPPLARGEIEELKKETPEWRVIDNAKIEREWKFADFALALAFVNKVGEIAESENHHPDILLFGWNKVRLSLSTHAIGGLSENDFILAAKIDRSKG
ncbi:4a-hydroxytetrahydrobiopterin dehydratase [bacterium]|nr:4a-hydroxytetrahydrobiopterin dehydratase [bacterium]